VQRREQIAPAWNWQIAGEFYGYVAEVTERKALEDELRRAREAAEGADRAKSAFLADSTAMTVK